MCGSIDDAAVASKFSVRENREGAAAELLDAPLRKNLLELERGELTFDNGRLELTWVGIEDRAGVLDAAFALMAAATKAWAGAPTTPWIVCSRSMANVLAIISRAVFEKMAPKTVTVGDVLATDRYASSHAAFEKVGDDAIFLVTVRPPDEKLWLVGILEAPKRKDDAWVSAANKTPIRDVTDALPKLKLASGAGITAKKGALGMSLQTPRVLTDDDVALLRPPPTANDAYRAAVNEVPIAAKARAEAAAVGDQTLRLANYRRPFAILKKLPAIQKQQMQALATHEEAGKLEELVDDENWSPMELVDVIDVASGQITHQLYLWPWGSGALFEHDTDDQVGIIVQHDYQAEPGDLPFRKQLASAFARAEPPLSDVVNFRLDWEPKALEGREAAFQAATNRLYTSFDGRSGGVPTFESLTAEQQALVHVLIENAPPDFKGFNAFHLAIPKVLKRWVGIDPPGVFEKRVGDRAAWKWLDDAAQRVCAVPEAVGALTEALSADEISDLCFASAVTDDYALFDNNGAYTIGESPAMAYLAGVLRLLGALIDASGDDAALAFARRVEALQEWRRYLDAVAAFALATRARRRKETIPDEHLPRALRSNLLGSGLHLDFSPAIRDLAEPMTAEQRSAYAATIPRGYSVTSLGDRKNGKKIKVPTLMGKWWIADLLPHSETAREVIEAIARTRDPMPKQHVLDVVRAIGPACVPFLDQSISATDRSPQHALLAAARKLFPKAPK